jgi:hypothetical protein
MMKKRWFIIFGFSFFCLNAYTTDNLRIPDVRTLGMGGVGVAHSTLFNPSLLAVMTESELRFDYYNRYGLKELATVSGGISFLNDKLPVGLHIASFGYDAYRESLFRFSAGKLLNDRLSFGISVQYALLQSELFETIASRLSTDIGASWKPVDNWLITASVINMPSITIESEDIDSERIAAWAVEVGMNWKVTNSLLITGGVLRNEENVFEAGIGMEYQPFTDFRLRAGLRSAPFRPSLGIGYRFSNISADVVMVYHPVLGFSTGLGLSYSFGSK